MEIPKIDIPPIQIKEIDIPKIRRWEVPRPTLDIILKPVVDIPACVDAHRNNLPSLIGKDEKGTYQACGTFDIPSFEPLEYNPNNFIYTAPLAPQSQELKDIQPEKPEIPQTKKEKIKFEPCPPEKPQFREGDYRNDKKIQRLVKYEKTIGGSCDPIWEDVPFRESFIGTPEVLISTAIIGLVAGGSAALVPIIQGIAKSAMKQIGKRFSKKNKST